MEKLNIAEILKDCPKGMELDCTVFENVTFEEVRTCCSYPITIITDGCAEFLTEYGCISYRDNAKCVIFPKGKTTWEGFQRPFKEGDIIFEDIFHSICIFKKEGSIKGTVDYYCGISFGSFYVKDEKNIDEHFGNISDYRLATKEERQKLFDAIKANGYNWNAETKTLEKLIEPKFKVGDKVKNKDGYVIDIIEIDTNNEKYIYKSPIGAIGDISFYNQNNYELVPNKFDITTLKPFDKVLVRDNEEQKWTVDMFGFYDKNLIYPFNCVGHYVNQCIPYKGNEHLLGTNDDCGEYFRNW